MALFGRKKKAASSAKASGCACNGGCAGCAATKTTGDGGSAASGNLCAIKVLGTGCPTCHALLERTKEAIDHMGISASVEYVTDPEKIMTYGVMRMPALVVNEKVVSAGKALKTPDVEKLLRSAD